MADNVTITAGAGTTISTEEVTTLNGATVSSQHVQRLILARRTADGTVLDITASNGTVSSVNASVTSGTLLSANTSRVAVIIINDSSAVMYVKYGITASASSFTYKLQADDILREELYIGRIDAVWASATGAARITEITP